MNLINEQDIHKETVFDIAKKMVIAARTAPKGRGVDNLVMAIAKDKEIKQISDKMRELFEVKNYPSFFMRDSENILSAQAMVLFGTKIEPLGLKVCGLCGFKNCEEKNIHPGHPCAFNTGDLGIAIGSACSIAMDNRVDNRIMYTVGIAVIEMGLLGEDVKISYGLPISASSKNPFFDRK